MYVFKCKCGITVIDQDVDIDFLREWINNKLYVGCAEYVKLKSMSEEEVMEELL